jgi:uncharacterized protein YciI
MLKFTVIYETDPEKLTLAQGHLKEHMAWIDAFHAKGTLLMIGVFENPLDGALGIFSSREAANEFAQGDPFVVHGVVRKYRVHGWNDILS